MAEIIVADTSPLIALARLHRLSLLESQFSKVLVPQIVAREWMAHQTEDAVDLTSALGHFIFAVPESESSLLATTLLREMDIGEAHAVALAVVRALPLLVDDLRGRKAAKRLGLKIYGSMTILLEGKKMGAIKEIAPELYRLRDSGYWISQDLIDRVLKLAGEK